MKLLTTKPTGVNALMSFRRTRIARRPQFRWLHARQGGGPVLRGESSWRTVCGFLIGGRTRHLIVQFRRFRRYT